MPYLQFASGGPRIMLALARASLSASTLLLSRRSLWQAAAYRCGFFI